MNKAFFLTVFGRDRPGIIARVTDVLAKNGVSLRDISMTRLEDEFCMVLLASGKNKKGLDLATKAVEKLAIEMKLSIFWHKASRSQQGKAKHKKDLKYVVSAYGRDQVGIVSAISKCLSKKNINITDLNTQVIGKGKQSRYGLVLECLVPDSKNAPGSLKRSLSAISRKLGIEINLNPMEVLEF